MTTREDPLGAPQPGASVLPPLARVPSAPEWTQPWRFALALALRQPGLWVWGLLGSLARGGWALLVVAMVALPSPVAISTAIGPDLVDANGLSERVRGLLVAGGLVTVVVVAAALLVAAASDVASIRITLADRATGPLRGGRMALTIDARAATWLDVRLAVLQALLALPALVAAIPAVQATIAIARDELLVPTRIHDPLLVRVVGAAAGPLILVVALLVAADLVYGWLARELIVRHVLRGEARPPRPGVPHPASRWLAISGPLEFLAAQAVAWLTRIGATLGALVAVGLAWRLVEVAYLSPTAGSGATSVIGFLVGVLEQGLATIVLVGVVGLGLALMGVAAGIRTALLTMAVLRHPLGWTGHGD